MTRPVFESERHRAFYERNMAHVRADSYHKALFYVLGVSEDTRRHIDRLFDFHEDCIRPEGLNAAWQTSGTQNLCRLSFNLWNGYIEPGQEGSFTPDGLFASGYAPYMVEGIKLRYPEYFRRMDRSCQGQNMENDFRSPRGGDER